MRDAAYCRAQALKCRELGMSIDDPSIVEHLILIAEEYEAEAARLEGPLNDTPPNPVRD